MFFKNFEMFTNILFYSFFLILFVSSRERLLLRSLRNFLVSFTALILLFEVGDFIIFYKKNKKIKNKKFFLVQSQLNNYFNYDMFKVSKMAYDLFKASKMMN